MPFISWVTSTYLFQTFTPPYLVKSFFLIFQGILGSISQVNEPRGWTFLCIWYENRRFWVHEVKRHYFSFYMALCIPIHLRQRTSRIYQDHQLFRRVLTSFVPPVHNQGVSLAPLQGLCPKVNIPADYWLILCILSLTDLFCINPCRHLAVDVFPTRSLYLSAFLLRLNSALIRYL